MLHVCRSSVAKLRKPAAKSEPVKEGLFELQVERYGPNVDEFSLLVLKRVYYSLLDVLLCFPGGMLLVSGLLRNLTYSNHKGGNLVWTGFASRSERALGSDGTLLRRKEQP